MPEQQEQLDEPISLNEVASAIKELNLSKTPGTDGLPAEWYETYSDELANRILGVYQKALQIGILPCSISEALTVVLLKPGRDTADYKVYRPLSVFSINNKILGKVLALRKKGVVGHLVHRDQ